MSSLQNFVPISSGGISVLMVSNSCMLARGMPRVLLVSLELFRYALFFIASEYRLQQIPDDIKPQIINIFDGFIEKFNPYKCDKCKMFALISDLGDTRENTTCQNGNGCFHALLKNE